MCHTTQLHIIFWHMAFHWTWSSWMAYSRDPQVSISQGMVLQAYSTMSSFFNFYIVLGIWTQVPVIVQQKLTVWTTCTTQTAHLFLYNSSLLITSIYKIRGKAWGQRKSGGIQDQTGRKHWDSCAMENMSDKVSTHSQWELGRDGGQTCLYPSYAVLTL